MVPQGWLKPTLILLRVPSDSEAALVESVARAMATTASLSEERIRALFLEALGRDGFSLGSGVAIPHTEMDGLQETLVCLAIAEKPVLLEAVDGRPPDVFLFILSKPDPHAHLLLLAHLARLTQSRTFLDGLRRSRSTEEVVALVRAAELRHSRSALAPLPAQTSQALIVISLSGERVVDALLIELVDRGFDEAIVIEGQSLREAATREIPLFAGFKDIFGDPGGRRIILIQTPAENADTVVEIVVKTCDEHEVEQAELVVVPVWRFWSSRGH